MWVNYVVFYLSNHLVYMRDNIQYVCVAVTGFDKIYGNHSLNDLTYDRSMNSMLLRKATLIFVIKTMLPVLEIFFILYFVSVNIDSRPGACGFYSIVAPRALGTVLVRFDPITMKPIRDEKTNLCLRCKTGERGLLLGIIGNSILHAFDGYVNNSSGTKEKVIENIYKKGDRAFNTG